MVRAIREGVFGCRGRLRGQIATHPCVPNPIAVSLRARGHHPIHVWPSACPRGARVDVTLSLLSLHTGGCHPSPWHCSCPDIAHPMVTAHTWPPSRPHVPVHGCPLVPMATTHKRTCTSPCPQKSQHTATTLSPLMPPRPGVPRTPPRHQDPQGHSEPSCPPQGGYGGDNGATHSYPGPDDHRGPLTATEGHRGPPPSAAPRPPGSEPGAGREPRFPAALKASFVFYSRALAGIRF